MQKIKQFFESDSGKDFLTVIIVILVGSGSFELGRLSKENESTDVKIEYTKPNEIQSANVVSATESNLNVINAPIKTQTLNNSAGKIFFASSKGKKYYPLGCSAGRSLKQENRIYFSTREEAEKAGYELSSSCK